MAREVGKKPEECPHHRGYFKNWRETNATKGQQEKDQKVSIGFSDMEVHGDLLENYGKSQIAVAWEISGSEELGMASVENYFKNYFKF